MLMYAFVFFSSVRYLRNLYSRIISFKKKKNAKIVVKTHIIPPLKSQKSVINNARYNPHFMRGSTTVLTFIVVTIFSTPLLYIYYFNDNTKSLSTMDMLDEFYLFLLDLSYHVALSVIIPLCLFIRNPEMRKFTFYSIKEFF